MVSLQNVWKEYKIDNETTFTALKDINLTIKAGEFSSIMGPSGSGKSTLMYLIGLLDSPSRGEILIERKSVSQFNDDRLSILRNQFVGFVFQQFNLINKLTVWENVLLPTVYNPNSPNNISQRAAVLLKRFGILDKADAYPNKISGGQQQRVAIARALITDPKLILADEPTGNLDSKNGLEIMKLLRELNETDGLTVLVVTHEKEIAKFAKRKIVIRDGAIVS